MSLLEKRQTIKCQSADRGREFVPQVEVSEDDRAKRTAEIRSLKVNTSGEYRKPSAWENFAGIFKADADKIA